MTGKWIENVSYALYVFCKSSCLTLASLDLVCFLQSCFLTPVLSLAVRSL